VKKFYPNMRLTQFKVGVFTVITIAILFGAYLWLSGKLGMGSQDELRISFENVMGLEVGDQVNYRGMEVGRVKKIKARNDDILVTARISSDINLREGARFFISDRSLMGGTGLHISQGDGAPLNLKKVQKGDTSTGIINTMDQASLAMDGLKTFFDSLRDDEGLLKRSSELIEGAGKAVDSIDGFAINAKNDLRQTLGEIETLTGEIRSVLKSSSERLDPALEQAPGVMADVSSALDSLKTLSRKLERTADALNSDESSAGLLLRDAALYKQLQSSVAQLDSLARDLRANPKKYLKFSIF
jgi:phospholipid/cholesterol/gamma-HCH transport system substrate-binding protein